MCLRLTLAVVALSYSAAVLPAQTTAGESQDISALLVEVKELKKRLADIEAKLAIKIAETTAVAAPAPTPVAPPPAQQAATAAAAPFAFGDFTWMNGQSRQKSQPLSNSIATVSLYLDTYYGYSLNQPKDNTIVGSGSVGRNTEWQINNATIGVDTNWKNVTGKVSLQMGNQLAVTQDQDGTVNRGRNLTVANNKYIGEALAGYHFDKWNGVNVQAGYFYSYIGLESYLLGENWSYNRSLVSEFTPFYFSGARIQIFPTDKVKIEPWFMNGYQTYGKWSRSSSFGLSNYWRPRESLGFVANFYYGTDTRNDPHRKRVHHDHSILYRYFNRPDANGISKMALSLNNHYGAEFDGVSPFPGRKTYMAGSSLVNRMWFLHDHLAWTVRGEGITNPGRYIALVPTATGFPLGPDNYSLKIWGLTSTFDILPTDSIAFRLEFMSRHSNVPFFAGRGGTTSPDGWQGTLGPFVPDVAKHENRLTFGINWRM